ncbi:class E sortase [Bifidobacterium callitrichos]|nr:class E sortase [Bifidobacterium callitrichos]
MRHSANSTIGTRSASRRNPAWQAVGILAELLITMAVICALYIAWQMWWTGVQAERTQVETREQVSWSAPGGSDGTSDGSGTKVAPAQSGDAPVQPQSANYGDLIAQLYIPRFGQGWQRNIVEGTDAEQLARHGLGHYQTTQMPGAVGNFAIAGHRSGYGEPLGDIDKLQNGDPIVIRTQDYWYVYTYTSYQIVDPTDVWVVAPNPTPDASGQNAQPTKRMITLTTCEPKYTTATHRWIAWGELKYWAKVSDGVPQELAVTDSAGTVRFANTSGTEMSLPARLGSLQPYVIGALVIWAVLAIAAAVAWRWPLLADIRAGRRRRPDASLYGALWRLQPGVLPIRIVLTALLVVAAVGALFQWTFPWAAANIPMLQQMSNYVAVQQ